MTREEFINPQRDTTRSLFLSILARARANGDMSDIDPILDYTLPNEHEISPSEGTPLTNYRFSIVPMLDFGGSEGIYLTCTLHGEFDGSGKERTTIGTIKTIETDLDACKRMGKLCGILMYHGTEYVNENLHRYTPQRELEVEYEHRRTIE